MPRKKKVGVLERNERVRLYPTPEQLATLERYAGAHRWVWNWALATRERIYKETGEVFDYHAQKKFLTHQLQNQPETVWLREIPRRVKDGALRDLQKAYSAAFRRIREGEKPGFPNFKRWQDGEATFEICHDATFRHDAVHVPLLGGIASHGGRSIVAETATGTARFMRDRAGDWWATLVYNPPEPPVTVTDPAVAVGIHLQLEHALSISDGRTLPQPEFGALAARKERRLQREHSRKTGEMNRERARIKLARHHRTTANRRRDWAHRTAHQLVTAYPQIVMQERDTASLLSDPESKRAIRGGRRRSARIADAAWGQLSAAIVTQGENHGRPVVVVPRGVPSARTCHVCGHILESLPLRIREWDCPTCGTHHIRGINAARNILAVGQQTVTADLLTKSA